MAINKIYKGQDVPISITLKDSAGDPVDLSGFNGIIAIVYYTKTQKVLERFSLNVLADFEDLEITDEPGGKFLIKLQSASTQNAESGKLSVEVKVQQNDAEYTDSKFHTVAVVENQFEICDALTVSDGSL